MKGNMSQSRNAEELKRFVQNSRKINGQTLDNDVQIDNVESADKLKTARTISLSGAVTSTPTAFDGSGDIDIPITKVYQSSLVWNGANTAGKVTPLGSALSCESNANRLAFINPDAIIIEYSSDNGNTWTALESNDTNNAIKIKLCTTKTSVNVGNTTPVTLNHQTRITIIGRDANVAYLYNTIDKMLVEVSTPHEIIVTVETQSGISDKWSEYGTYTLYGYSSWNDLPIVLSTFGGHADQLSNIWKIRLTFKVTKVNSPLDSRYPAISRLRMFGSEQWIVPNNYSHNGHIYELDEKQNTYFPKNVIVRGDTLKIGSTTITETQLKALLNLLT